MIQRVIRDHHLREGAFGIASLRKVSELRPEE